MRWIFAGFFWGGIINTLPLTVHLKYLIFLSILLICPTNAQKLL